MQPDAAPGRRGHVLGLTPLRLAVSLAAAVAAVYWGRTTGR